MCINDFSPVIQTLDMKETGFCLRKIREQKNISVAEVAEYLGLSSKSVYNWEIGTTNIDIRHLVSLCDYYGVTFDEVVKKKQECREYYEKY